MPKEKIRLSTSKPVRIAKLNSDGGLQYSGTKSGSVKPKREVQKLTVSISFRLSLFFSERWTTNQIARSIKLQINQAYCIYPMYFLGSASKCFLHDSEQK